MDLAAATDLHHHHEEQLMTRYVRDAVDTYADPVEVLLADELLAARRPWLVGQGADGGVNAGAVFLRESGNLWARRRQDPDF